MSEPDNLSIVVVGNERVRVPAELPILPVRDAVVFPGMNVPLSVGRTRSLAALEEAGDGGFLVVATQKSPETEEPTLGDLHPIACIARIVRVVDARGQARQALVLGLARTRLAEAPEGAKGALRARIDPLSEYAMPDRRGRGRARARRGARASRDRPARRLPGRVEEPGRPDSDAGPARGPDRLERGPVERRAHRAALRAGCGEAPLAHRERARARDHDRRDAAGAARRADARGRGPEAPRTPAPQAHARDPEGARRGRGRRARGGRAGGAARGRGAAARGERARRPRAAPLPRPAAARAGPSPGAHLPGVDRRPALVEADRGPARPRERAGRARRRPSRPREGEGPHPRIPGRAQARAAGEGADPLLRGPAGRRQDLAGPLDRARARTEVRARLARRRARRGRDPRAPPHLRRRHAGPHPPEPAPRRLAQPGVPARRGGQAGRRLPGRPVVGPARGARSRAELDLLGSLPRGAVRPLARALHRHGEHARDHSARPARPHGGDRAAGLHGPRQARDRARAPDPEAARGARSHAGAGPGERTPRSIAWCTSTRARPACGASTARWRA